MAVSRKITNDLALGLFDSDYKPSVGFVTNRVGSNIESQTEAAESLKQKAYSEPSVEGKLSVEESDAFDREREAVKKEIVMTKARISNIKKTIDRLAEPENGQELSFKVDISNKAALRKAVRKIFGVKTDTITYTMYKRALQALQQLQKEDVGDYFDGNWG